MIAELSLEAAWDLLSSDPAAVLIDVRTQAEWNFVGVPDLRGIGKELMLAEWITYPEGTPNADFLAQAASGLDTEGAVLLLCRSGARSLAAAQALESAGFSSTYNVVAGFEGDLDAEGHRHGGWKDALPWRQG